MLAFYDILQLAFEEKNTDASVSQRPHVDRHNTMGHFNF